MHGQLYRDKSSNLPAPHQTSAKDNSRKVPKRARRTERRGGYPWWPPWLSDRLAASRNHKHPRPVAASPFALPECPSCRDCVYGQLS